MFSILALTLMGDFLLVLCLAKLINRSLANLMNPSNFYFDPSIASENQKLSIKRYLGILKKNLNRSIDMLHNEKYVNVSQKSSLLPKLDQFIDTVGERINNEIESTKRCMIRVDITQDIKIGSQMLCTEINRMFYDIKYDVRLMYVSDEKGSIFKLYRFQKFHTGNSNYPVYKFTDTDLSNKEKNRCFYLINYEQHLHKFLDHDMLLMYIDLETIEISIIDGKIAKYTIVNHDPETAPEGMLNPNEHHLEEYIITYHGRDKESESSNQSDGDDQDESHDENQDGSQNNDENE